MTAETDLISRQAAIDAINTWDKFGVDERSRIVRWHEGLEPYVHLRDVLTAIVNLPPAQPTLQPTCNQLATTEGDLISRQALCQYAINQKGRSVTPNDIMRFPSADSNANKHVQHVGSVDLISRQAVLELPRNVQRSFFGEVISETVNVKAIEALPTINPRKGKWVYNQKRGTVKIWTCSECGWNDIGEWNFCPNCGADMRGEQDG